MKKTRCPGEKQSLFPSFQPEIEACRLDVFAVDIDCRREGEAISTSSPG
jgi:hypothetical protein